MGGVPKNLWTCLKTITSPTKNLLKVELESDEGSIPNYHFIGNNEKEVCIKLKKNARTIIKIQNVGCFYRIKNLASYKKKWGRKILWHKRVLRNISTNFNKWTFLRYWFYQTEYILEIFENWLDIWFIKCIIFISNRIIMVLWLFFFKESLSLRDTAIFIDAVMSQIYFKM